MMRENDQHYPEFQAATTRLAVEVPPSLQKKILGIEDRWDKISDKLDDQAQAKWFKDLDDIRQTVLDSLPSRSILDR
jgi:hypothetical protein